MGDTPNIPKENLKRANKIKRAIGNYGKADDLQTAIKDVLSDVMHLCDASDLDFSTLLSKANVNYRYDSRCANCFCVLTAQDTAGDADNFCRKCLKKLGPKFTWHSSRVP